MFSRSLFLHSWCLQEPYSSANSWNMCLQMSRQLSSWPESPKTSTELLILAPENECPPGPSYIPIVQWTERPGGRQQMCDTGPVVNVLNCVSVLSPGQVLIHICMYTMRRASWRLYSWCKGVHFIPYYTFNNWWQVSARPIPVSRPPRVQHYSRALKKIKMKIDWSFMNSMEFQKSLIFLCLI